MKKLAIIAFTLAILIVGMAMAADPINATVETQGISTTTGTVVLGTMTNSETIVFTGSTMDIRDNPPLGAQGVNIPGTVFTAGVNPNNVWALVQTPMGSIVCLPERQAVMSYTESILADNGYSEFNEIQSMDTGNKVVNQDNFKSTEQFDYVAFSDAMGRATTSESLLLDLVSQGSLAADRFICPFATGDQGFIPPYCNVYEMGSSFTGTQVSEITQANTNFIAKSADVPTEAAYTVGLSGTGSAAAWINTHVMEGRTAGYYGAEEEPVGYEYVFWNYDMNTGWLGDGIFNGGGWMQGVDLVYKEKTTASGVIEAFSKSMAIQDGVRRL
ncbi:MAG: hypothetical protein A4E36_00618 [Methanoregulaceae archaeon PtaB.Bin009]|jgi:hypothetical protein|nr:MAG: hypothetical protein A4E36_00618 [Methanoregulaceae archaeon PtaB.Bin009]OPY38835.1 MAG: hypothetical protein A4E41_01850 [Methanoregulaceae archaeon PtaU1.Bin066]HNQ28755.1 hypothetical protein [Methanolinea sp.]